MRHVIVLVLIGIAHVGPVQNQGMIQQRAIAVRRTLQLVGQVRSRIQVIFVESCVCPDLLRIVLMMRSTMEAHEIGRASCRERVRLRGWEWWGEARGGA